MTTGIRPGCRALPWLLGLVLGGIHGLHAQTVDRAVTRLVVEVELSCPSCAAGLERRLARVDHVADVELRVEDSQVIVTSEAGQGVSSRDVRDIVRNAGFTPTAIVVTAVGRIVETAGALELRLPDDSRLPLTPDETTRARLTGAAGRVVRVTGRAVATATGHEDRVHAFRVETP